MEYKIGNNKFVWSNNVDANGYLQDKCGGLQNPNKTNFNSFSLHLEWQKMLKAKSYAVLIIDYDASKVVGFPFIHWVALNIKTNSINENQSFIDYTKWIESKKDTYDDSLLWQGFNSSTPKTTLINNEADKQNKRGILPNGFTNDLNQSVLYFAPYPPDKDHIYTVYVYGLDKQANELPNQTLLNKPFYIDDFMSSIDNNIVQQFVFNFKYKKVG